MVISFDFDCTLSRLRTQQLARYLKEKGHEIWIVTSRTTEQYGLTIGNADLYHVALNVGITPRRIHFTNGEFKAGFFRQHPEFFMHFDDDRRELEHLATVPIIPIDVKESFWINKAMAHIASGTREEQRKGEREA